MELRPQQNKIIQQNIIVPKSPEVPQIGGQRTIQIAGDLGGDIVVPVPIEGNLITGRIITGSSSDMAVRAGRAEPIDLYPSRVLDRIYDYDNKARLMKGVHNGLQLLIFIGAAAATVLVSFSTIVTAILTGLVTVATAIGSYYKFGEHARMWERTAEDLALEYNRFHSARGVYKDKPGAEMLELFMDRVESIEVEKSQRISELDRLKTEKASSLDKRRAGSDDSIQS